MKKAVISILLLIVLALGIFFLVNSKDKQFSLETKYYSNNDQQEISKKTLTKLIKDKESFLLFIYQPMCVNSTKLSETLEAFQKQEEVFIYKIPFSKLKGTLLEDEIKYYPSFVLFNEGKVVDYLDANKDSDTDKFTKVKEFTKWYSSHVSKAKVERTNNQKSEVKETNETNLKKVNLEEVERKEDKVNIYLFWGNGCPHCEEEISFFESLDEETKNKFSLYKFESWYSKENEDIAKAFAKALDVKLEGVPFTVIGDKAIFGYGDGSDKNILEAIEKAQESKIDIYFDKIKNND